MNFLMTFCYTLGIIGDYVLGMSPECPENTRTCYNCDVDVNNCNSNDVSELTDEQCKAYLSGSSIWNVVYDSTTGTCRMNDCKGNGIIYKKGSVVYRKTCETVCADFTLMAAPGHQVSALVSYDVYMSLTLVDCLTACLETNSSCTVMHEDPSNTCRLYTHCEDVCELSYVNDPGLSVYKRQCEPAGAWNVAFNKSTSMSSLWTDWGEPYIYRSPLGVDGNTVQNKYEDTCFVTDGEVGPWWRVDLGTVYRIHRVFIYNRLDCCSERAHDLLLSVGLSETDLVVLDYLPQLYSTFPFTLPSNTDARYVQLGINSTAVEYFHLCEVQVFGTPVPSTSSISGSSTTTVATDTSVSTSAPVTSVSTSAPVTSVPTSAPVTSVSVSTTVPSTPAKIYIMPCLCNHNKSFINMTMGEIVAELIQKTKIDPKNTTLSISKLNCRTDNRKSSKIIGAIGASVLSTVFGLLICSDLLTLGMKKKIP